MKKRDRLPEHELSDFTVDDVLNGNFEASGEMEMGEDDGALEDDLILGDEEGVDDTEEEYEIEFEDFDDDDDEDDDDDDLDEDETEEDDLILDTEEDFDDLDDEPDEDTADDL